MAGQTGNERKKKLKGAGRFFSYKRQFFVCGKKKKKTVRLLILITATVSSDACCLY